MEIRKGEHMGVAGLGTYSSTSFYYKMTNQSNTNINDEFGFGLLSGKMDKQDESADAVDKPART